jgi:hypothetical protein
MMTELQEIPVETRRDQAIARLKQKREFLTRGGDHVHPAMGGRLSRVPSATKRSEWRAI